MKYSKAFSLTEVLITLGVIAAMTIPTLINNTTNKENIAKWKKAYSSMAQVWLELAQENGGIMGGIFTTTGSSLANDYGDLIFAKTGIVRRCMAPTADTDEQLCWHKINEYYTLNKTSISTNFPTASKAILKDGTYILIGATSNSCTADAQCLFFGVDVNGKKGPNIQGKDIFFGVAKGGGKVMPHSTTRDVSDPNDNYNCVESSTKTSSNQGQGCSKLALYCDEIDYTTGTCK